MVQVFRQLHHEHGTSGMHITHPWIRLAPSCHVSGARDCFCRIPSTACCSAYKGFSSQAFFASAVVRKTLGSEISTTTSCPNLKSLLPLATAWQTSSQIPTVVFARIELSSTTVPQSTRQSLSTLLHRVIKVSCWTFEPRPI